MNVELIRIEPSAAKAKLASYRKAIAERHHAHAAEQTNAEWTRIAEGYRMAAKGLALIELSKAMATGGWDEQGRPKFAVACADRKRVKCNADNSALVFFDVNESSWKRRRTRFEFPMRNLPARPAGSRQAWGIEAIVPIVPPDVLPRPDLDLSRRVILWEADWTEAPIDPLLLLPIGGDLYAVEAAWDLTPLERAVISGR